MWEGMYCFPHLISKDKLMPQTKEAKRKTAIKNFTLSISFHEAQIPHADASRVDIHRKKIANLQKHVANTEAKH